MTTTDPLRRHILAVTAAALSVPVAALPAVAASPTHPDAELVRLGEALDKAWAEERAVALDASAPTWPVERADAVIAINLVHISPWAATLGLMAGATHVLVSDGVLVLYGPYKEHGVHTAPSNAAFDASLRASNPAWGVRDLEDVVAAAWVCDLALAERVAMPANNLILVFRRQEGSE